MITKEKFIELLLNTVKVKEKNYQKSYNKLIHYIETTSFIQWDKISYLPHTNFFICEIDRVDYYSGGNCRSELKNFRKRLKK